MELLLIRHGRPARTHAAQGPADPPLTDLGHRQAEALATWLAEEGMGAVYASPLRRARETAAPLAAKLGLEVRIDASLSEYDKDASSYVPIEELQAAGDLKAVELPDDVAAFQRTVVDGIEAIVAEHQANPANASGSGKVALVCHGGVINVYASHVLSAANEWLFLPHYTSISRLHASSKGRRTIDTLNETAHLRVADVPMTEL